MFTQKDLEEFPRMELNRLYMKAEEQGDIGTIKMIRKEWARRDAIEIEKMHKIQIKG